MPTYEIYYAINHHSGTIAVVAKNDNEAYLRASRQLDGLFGRTSIKSIEITISRKWDIKESVNY